MIVEPNDANEAKYTEMIDIGRPTLIDDKQYSVWNTIHNWIRESDIELLVNSQFNTMQDNLDNKLNYMGGGFKYCFWFQSIDDSKVFKQFIEEQTLIYKKSI